MIFYSFSSEMLTLNIHEQPQSAFSCSFLGVVLVDTTTKAGKRLAIFAHRNFDHHSINAINCLGFSEN
jgi:hypothetical protein